MIDNYTLIAIYINNVIMHSANVAPLGNILILCNHLRLAVSHKQSWRPLATNRGSCDFNDVVAFSHNQLWWPLAAIFRLWFQENDYAICELLLSISSSIHEQGNYWSTATTLACASYIAKIWLYFFIVEDKCNSNNFERNDESYIFEILFT